MTYLQIRQAVTPGEIDQARQIRQVVFVEEQGIPAALEFADGDQNAIHLIAYGAAAGAAAGPAVATARLVLLSAEEGAVTRVAVLPAYRGQGYGRALVEQLEVLAHTHHLTALTLNPHHYLERFYQTLGYVTVPGGEVEVAGHQLITMQKQLTLSRGCFGTTPFPHTKTTGFKPCPF